MSEEKPSFKFKKASKKVGDLDVTDTTTEWLMLERLEVNDLPSFIHIQRLWCREETEDQVDTEGNMVSKGFKKEPAMRLYKGFIKDGKYIVEDNSPLGYQNDHQAQTQLVARLEKYLADGYKMVESNQYQPTYYANERTPMIPSDIRQMVSNMSGAVAQHNTATQSRRIMKIALSSPKQSQNP